MIFNLRKASIATGLLATAVLVNATFAHSTNININSIQTIIKSENTQVFDTIIQFKASTDLVNWSIGFYMPRTFNALTVAATGTDINPNLNMEICDDQTDTCSKLVYVKENSKQEVYADGYTNVLAPESVFPLKAHHSYTIQLINNNQWAPANINSMPQSFFVTDQDNNLITPINVSLSAYNAHNGFSHIGGYDANKTHQLIEQHITQNWQNSAANNDTINKLGLIPSPKSILDFNAKQAINLQKVTFDYTSDFDSPFDQNYVNKILGIKFNQAMKNSYSFAIKQEPLSKLNHNPEAYTLRIKAHTITISAATEAGVFYALESLRQLAFLHKNKLPSVYIKDQPQFKYRGLLIDVSRHYFTIDELKTMIDTMAALKLNSLHLHFADDEAWRLELPSITGDIIKKAAFRGYVKNSTNPASMMLQANQDLTNYKDFDPSKKILIKDFPNAITNYGLYYSMADIRGLIQYANDRQITIIPEVDLPGHARALVHAMPDIFINPLDHSDYISVQGYYNDVIPVCLYNQKSAQAKQFTAKINQIIHDIGALFAGQTTVYAENEVSVGGDEVSKDAWSNDSSCQGNLTALDRSQQFFKELQTANPEIKLSGWQQFVQTDHGDIGKYSMAADKTAHTWVWDPSNPGIEHARILASHGYPTVLAYSDHLYFDLTYTPDAWESGLYWAGSFLDTQAALTSAITALQSISALNASDRSNILGLEGTLWTENTTNARHLQYKTFPKITGLAEASWSPFLTTTSLLEKPNWQSLATRLGMNDQSGVLGYLNNEFGVVYRGMPYGISKEVPVK
ncbi:MULTISPECIES: family 20 glycosylhydrolase [Cysteiniphilum]|uniref:family 20 glycosylhydrolase n=1 Tax=Cysteiniphilum TaxID=2056696 RepID=UPI00178481F0|nr:MULTISPECIES: family 20 glycosylhydrolase [Cysteiniphilum]